MSKFTEGHDRGKNIIGPFSIRVVSFRNKILMSSELVEIIFYFDRFPQSSLFKRARLGARIWIIRYIFVKRVQISNIKSLWDPYTNQSHKHYRLFFEGFCIDYTFLAWVCCMCLRKCAPYIEKPLLNHHLYRPWNICVNLQKNCTSHWYTPASFSLLIEHLKLLQPCA